MGILQANIIIIIITEIFFLSLQKYSNDIQIILVLDTAVCGFILIANGYLISFHIWLKCQNMSTYQYIQIKKNKKINKVAQNPDPVTSRNIISTLDYSKPTHSNRNQSLNNEIAINSPLDEKFNKTEEVIRWNNI